MAYAEVMKHTPGFAACQQCHCVVCLQKERCIAVPHSCLAMPAS